jgi:putative holliday junction resolvase
MKNPLMDNQRSAEPLGQLNVQPNIQPEGRREFLSVLALDIGKKRIGVAGCDGLGMMATGITTLERRTLDQVVQELRPIIQSRRVHLLLAGMPYTLDGEIGPQARRTHKTALNIAAALDLPLEMVDERLTSYAAEELMKSQNISTQWNKALIDRKAAAIILQQWLDSRS